MEGAAAGADEGTELADGADVPMEAEAALDAAGKDDDQTEAEGAAGQDGAATEEVATPPTKKAKKPVTKPAAASKSGTGKVKTRSQSDKTGGDKGAGGRKKPAPITFPSSEPK